MKTFIYIDILCLALAAKTTTVILQKQFYRFPYDRNEIILNTLCTFNPWRRVLLFHLFYLFN